MTLEERERRAYITDAPDAAALGEAFDIDAAAVDLEEENRQLSIDNEALQDELDELKGIA